MSERALHVAVDIGGERVTVAVGSPTSSVRPTSVRLGHRADVASSAVFVAEDGFVFGDAAERRALAGPERVLRDYAHRIGDEVPMTVARRSVRPEDVYVGVLEWALAAAVDATGRDAAGLTVVVPAGWGARRRTGLRDALRARGIPAHLMSAPEAAAHARMATATDDDDLFAATRSQDDLFALYDLGAHSCDLAVVRVRDGGVRVLAARSLTDFGGADVDDMVLNYLQGVLPEVRDAGPVALAAIRRECRAAKEALSYDTETVVPVSLASGEHLVRIVREDLEALLDEEVRESVLALEDLCADAGVATGDLSAVLLSGGSARIPRVTQLLSETLGVPVEADGDPEGVLARGAAQAPVPTGEPGDGEERIGPEEPAAPRPGLRMVLLRLVRLLLPPTPGGAEARPGPRVAAETPDDARSEAPPPRASASRSPGALTGLSGDPKTSPPPPSGAPRSRRDHRAGV